MTPDYEVVIIGAGFAGMGTAIRLKQAGVEDLLILERAHDVGGTWRDNTYPGVAVDIPSFTYSYAFEPNPGWSRAFAPGNELMDYATDVADRYGLRPHLRFNSEVETSTFDEEQHLWRITLAGGEEITARFVVSCHGALVTPLEPNIPGLAKFKGKVINTMRWDHDYDLTGKRVAVIGTGATALQVIPSIAPSVAHLDVYQRTPIWVFPKVDPRMPAGVRALFRYLPPSQRAVRLGTSALSEALLTLGVVHNRELPFLTSMAEQICLAYLRSEIKDPVLREKLTPKYGFGCKRPSFSNQYYAAFLRDNVDLITDGIETLTATGIRDSTDVLRKVDVVILATGFKVFDVPYALTGTDGLTVNERWHRDRKRAYQGSSMRHYPNLFLNPGPYGVSGASWFDTIELGAIHSTRVISEARKRQATRVEISAEAFAADHARVVKRVGRTRFVHPSCAGSNTYYLDEHNDAPFLRPSSGLQSLWQTKRFNLDDYEYTGPGRGIVAA